jgi:hypothetical protein
MRKIISMFFIVFGLLGFGYSKIEKKVIRGQIENFTKDKIFSISNIRLKGEASANIYYFFRGGVMILSEGEIVFYSRENIEFSKKIVYEYIENKVKVNKLPSTKINFIKESEILPLTKTKWGICPPFNDKMPIINGVKSYAGHIGVAIAQLMRYWESPQSGKGSFEYDLRGEFIKADFNHNYDYEKMPYILKTYSSVDEIDEVSNLIYDTTVSVKTNFYNFSKGENNRIIPSLTENFGFSKSLKRINKQDYDDKTWFEIIKNELNSGRIILYNLKGDTLYDHIAIVDGYIETDTEKLIHINLGCGGKMDGYYSFNSVWKFTNNEAQFMIVNVFPEDKIPVPKILKTYSSGINLLIISRSFDYIFWNISSDNKKKYSFNVYSYDFNKGKYVLKMNVKEEFVRIIINPREKRRYIIKTVFNGRESKASSEIVFN